MNLHALAIPALITPFVMYVAMVAQRFGGGASAGLIASLPLPAAVGALGVGAGSGTRAVAEFAVVAATFVPAQMAYGLAFTVGMRQRGFRTALVSAVASYTLVVALVSRVPDRVAVVAGVVAVVLAQRFLPAAEGEATPHEPSAKTGLVVSVGTAGVLAVVVLVQLAGPAAGAFLAGLPVVTPVLAMFLARSQGRAAGAQTMVGMVRGIPMSLALLASLALLSQPLGTTVAVAIGLTLAVAAAAALWHTAQRGGRAAVARRTADAAA